MSFTRTNYGITNSSAFFKSDLIVYTEGGVLERGTENSAWAIDVIFWRSIFSRFLPNRRVKFKPLGSKVNVLPYAQKIRNSEIENSIATMDRDHDAHKRSLLEHPRIIYTHGYSWENDAWCLGAILSYLGSLHPDGELPEEDTIKIKQEYSDFLKSIRRIVFIDILCSIQEIEGIPREKFLKLMDTNTPICHKVKKDKIRQLINTIKEKRNTPLKYSGNLSIRPEIDCYGKLFSSFGYSLLTHYYRSITGIKNLQRESADISIANHISNSKIAETEPELINHYKRAFEALTTATH